MISVFWNRMKWYIVSSGLLTLFFAPYLLMQSLKGVTALEYVYSQYVYIYMLLYILLLALLFFYPYVYYQGKELLSMRYQRRWCYLFCILIVCFAAGIPAFFCGIHIVDSIGSFVVRLILVAIIFSFSFYIVVFLFQSIIVGSTLYLLVCMFPLIKSSGDVTLEYFQGNINIEMIVAVVLLMVGADIVTKKNL